MGIPPEPLIVVDLERQLEQVREIARTFERNIESLREENKQLTKKNEELERELKVMREWLKK